MLDLQVVPYCVDDQVALDQSGHEGRVSVGVAQVHSGARAEDRVVAENPVPCRALGRNADGLLIVAMAAYHEVFQGNVMRPAGIPLRLHRIDRQVAALEHQVADHHVARVDDAYRVAPLARDESGGRAASRPRDRDRSTGFTRQIAHRQAVAVLAGGKSERIAGAQESHRAAIGVRRRSIDRLGARGADDEQRRGDAYEKMNHLTDLGLDTPSRRAAQPRIGCGT